MPATADAAAGTVHLTGVFALPVNPAPSGLDPATGKVTTNDEKLLCTPEPRGQRIYGTQSTFDSTAAVKAQATGLGWPASTALNYPASTNADSAQPDAAYVPANQPSSNDLTPALQAGASSDLCFGFTLTPNLQQPALADPSVVDPSNPILIKGPASAGLNPRGQRLQNDPPLPDVDQTHIGYNADGSPVQGDDMKKATIQLPDGFLGDPDSTSTCTDAQFGLGKFLAASCPIGGASKAGGGTYSTAENTQVGTAFVRISTVVKTANPGGIVQAVAVGGNANQNGIGIFKGGQVFNLTHGPNELARLGVALQPVSGIAPEKFVVRLVLAPDGSGRVQGVVDDAPRNVYSTEFVNPDGTLTSDAVPSSLYVESVGIRAWGSAKYHPAMSADFAQWGTDCSTTLQAHADVATYGGTDTALDSNTFKLTGCDQLAPFNPSVSVTTAEHTPGVPTAAEVSLNLPQTKTASGLPTPLLKDASVTLPAGLEIGAQAAARDGGLHLCTATAFGVGNTAANACPAGSSVGDLSIVTPLLKTPFVGHVYLGPQSAVGELPSLYLEATPEGATAADAPRIKLVGTVKADENGQITTTFADTPQLRFSSLKIEFSGGPNALFSTPRTCGTTTGTSTFVSSASTAPVTSTSSLTIDQGCDLPAFAPAIGMAPADSTVGSRAPTTITIARPDQTPWLSGINVSLPSGFLADLTQASECPAAQAATGACSDASRIATVTTVAGVGSSPYTLVGQMYLSERASDAVAGATIVVHAQLGDLDLGNVVVPARIDLRPTDAGLTLSTTAPTRFHGLALNLRSISVALDRPNFPLNPTACGPLAATAAFTGDGGQTATASSSVSYTGCAARPLQPSMTATLTGETKVLGHPQVNVSIKTRPGDTNLKSTSVTLPAGVSADLKNVQVQCDPAAFNAGGCPATTRVGSAVARVAITNDVLNGDVYLVRVAGQVLPGLGLSFTGRYTQRIMSTVRIDKSTRLVTDFASIPDLPLTQLDLTVAGGAKSPIQIGSACTADTSWDATFGGQGGQTATTKIAVPCTTVAVPTPKVTWSVKKGLTLTVTPPAGKTIKSAKLSVPSGFKLRSGSSKSVKKIQKSNIKFKATGGKIKTKISSKNLSVTGSGAGPTKVVVTLKPKGYTISKAALKKFKKGKSIKVKIRIAASNGKVYSATRSVKLAK